MVNSDGMNRIYRIRIIYPFHPVKRVDLIKENYRSRYRNAFIISYTRYLKELEPDNRKQQNLYIL